MPYIFGDEIGSAPVTAPPAAGDGSGGSSYANVADFMSGERPAPWTVNYPAIIGATGIRVTMDRVPLNKVKDGDDQPGYTVDLITGDVTYPAVNNVRVVVDKYTDGTTGTVPLGENLYVVAAGTLIEQIYFDSPGTVVRIGSTDGGDEVLEDTVIADTALISLNQYFKVATTIYFTGQAADATIKIYKR